MRDYIEEPSYCGCCGRAFFTDGWWCSGCQDHVAGEGPLWERTYFAQHGVSCPFQVPLP
jgi:hypothetical protein